MSIYSEQVSLAINTELPLIHPPSINLDVGPETIISYDSNGVVASRFKDNTWDFSAIGTKGARLNFDANKYSSQVLHEIKSIMYARIYWSPSIRSIQSLRITPVHALADWASKNGLSIQKLLNDDRLVLGISSSLAALSNRSAQAIGALVNELTRIRIINSSFVIAPADFNLSDRLEGIVTSIPEDRIKQTAVIPTRIYAELITNLSSFIQDYADNAKRIESFFLYVSNGLRTGGHLKTYSGFKSWYKRPENYQKILQEFQLTELAIKYGLSDKKRWNVFLRDIQEAAKYWIHLFTGMRDQEVNSLSRECLSRVKNNGVSTKIIQGFTTKTIGSGATATYWITTDIIDLGLNAALSLGEISAIDNQWELHPIEFPLLAPLTKPDKEKHSSRFHANAPLLRGLSGERIADFLSRFPSLNVSESDLAELHEFDGFRDWSEDVKLNEPWPLTTHQCRRSLAVYLARSGLVSIGSLQLQFKHLLTAMTSYYRRNSSYAKNFILNDTKDEFHMAQLKFIDSVETEQRVAQFLDYEQSVIKNQDQLWGGEGSRIRSASKTDKPLIIVTDTLRTKDKFLKGEMAFKRGPIGGCTNVGPCDKVSITHVGTPCMGCSKFIGDTESISKVEIALNQLYRVRDKYPVSSLHYQQLQTDITEFESKLKKAKDALND
ncbi:hypothetical protein [Methylophilus sp.]|uniref:hypothetical protein n=1 Tax=Methylophilus sp. TaxID=29541 RepID=UPI0011D31C88|nr:hypothetical protein [Methylophilus sp.]TXI46043.1 MAG: hypothetical protein E6Q52_04560 [Methylophilus sp.]